MAKGAIFMTKETYIRQCKYLRIIYLVIAIISFVVAIVNLVIIYVTGIDNSSIYSVLLSMNGAFCTNMSIQYYIKINHKEE